MTTSYTGLRMTLGFCDDADPLDTKSDGLMVIEPIIAALTGVFDRRDGHLIGLAVDVGDERSRMLPLVEIPEHARTLAGTGKTLRESMEEL